MGIKIGGQSTLNDLLALRNEIDARIEEVKAIKIGEVSQIESGSISSGSIFDPRPNGIYRMENQVSGIPNYDAGVAPGEGRGMSISLVNPHNNQYVSFIYTDWSGSAWFGYKNEVNGLQVVNEFLTSQNTIVDANGFIKTA